MAVLCPKQLCHEERPGIGAVRRDQTDRGRLLIQSVGRCAVHHRQKAKAQYGGEVEEVVALNTRAPPLGEQQGNEHGILLTNLAGQLRQDAGRHAEVNTDIEDMPYPHAATGNDQDLVLL